MSAEGKRWAWEQVNAPRDKRLGAVACFVLLNLGAEHVMGKGVHRSSQFLADLCQVSRSTFSEQIVRLEALGLLVRETRPGRARWTTYRLVGLDAVREPDSKPGKGALTGRGEVGGFTVPEPDRSRPGAGQYLVRLPDTHTSSENFLCEHPLEVVATEGQRHDGEADHEQAGQDDSQVGRGRREDDMNFDVEVCQVDEWAQVVGGVPVGQWSPNTAHMVRAEAFGLDVEQIADRFREHNADAPPVEVATWDECFHWWLRQRLRTAPALDEVDVAALDPDGFLAALVEQEEPDVLRPPSWAL